MGCGSQVIGLAELGPAQPQLCFLHFQLQIISSKLEKNSKFKSRSGNLLKNRTLTSLYCNLVFFSNDVNICFVSPIKKLYPQLAMSGNFHG